MIEGDPPCDQARARVADQHRPIDLECIQELDDIAREVLDPIAVSGLSESPWPRCDTATARIQCGKRSSTGSYDRHESVGPGSRTTAAPDSVPCSAYDRFRPDSRVTVAARNTVKIVDGGCPEVPVRAHCFSYHFAGMTRCEDYLETPTRPTVTHTWKQISSPAAAMRPPGEQPRRVSRSCDWSPMA